MIIDTGAYLTLISPAVAKLLNYSEYDRVGKIKVSSPIGEEKGYRIKLKRFETCHQSQEDLDVGVLPIHDSYGIDGLIGLNFLEKYNIKINFESLINSIS